MERAYTSNDSSLSCIANAPTNPMDLFKDFLSIMRDPDDISMLTMSLATLNKEFGVLNRTVLFRGLTRGPNENITFVTEKNSQKYADIQANPKVSVVLLFSREINGQMVYRQIRCHGRAVELSKTDIARRWSEEPLFAKIRSKITECGAPVDWQLLKEKHDQVLKAHQNGRNALTQTDTYTSFEIQPTLIDFYFAEHGAIGDRVVYRKNANNIWACGHVYP